MGPDPRPAGRGRRGGGGDILSRAAATPLLLLPLLGVRAACAQEPEAARPDTGEAAPGVAPRYDGERGLWVSVEADSFTARWLTANETRGRLEVRGGGGTVGREVTPAGRVHAVRLPRPEMDRVVLRYGAADGAGTVHETAVHLYAPERPPVEYEGVDTLYVVGDVHGEYERLRALLRNAGLVDGGGRWTGGRSHLVFLGDLVDRGSRVRQTLWFVYGLQEQAAAAGGRVHLLLGNHEVMLMTGDHRYVAPREMLLAQLYGVEYWRTFDPRTSVLGRWLASRPAVVRIDEVVLAHGGLGPAYAAEPLEAMDDSLAAWVREPFFRFLADSTVRVPPMDSLALDRRIRFLFEAPGPLWYRDYARSDTLGDALATALASHGSRLHVVAHTPMPEIREAYDGRLVFTDLQEPATQLLMLVRGESGYERWVVPLAGSRRPLAGSAR